MAGMAPKSSNHVSQKGNGAGKWMFIPLKMVLIGIDPYPNQSGESQANCMSQ
jgi:hypothetical protein